MPKRKRTEIPEQDAFALRFAGWLGHTHVVLVDDGRPGGNRNTGFECSDLARARAYAREHSGRSPTIYQRLASGEWKQAK